MHEALSLIFTWTFYVTDHLISFPMNSLMQKYIQLEGNRSNLVHTAWALMGLIHSGQVTSAPKSPIPFIVI